MSMVTTRLASMNLPRDACSCMAKCQARSTCTLMDAGQPLTLAGGTLCRRALGQAWFAPGVACARQGFGKARSASPRVQSSFAIMFCIGRLARVLRIVRVVRLFRALRTLVASLMGTWAQEPGWPIFTFSIVAKYLWGDILVPSIYLLTSRHQKDY
eukprot:g31739.t1